VNLARQAAYMAPGILTNPTIAETAATPDQILDTEMEFVASRACLTIDANQYAAQLISGAPLQIGG